MESSEMLTNDGVPTGDDHHFRREDRGLRWRRIAGHLADASGGSNDRIGEHREVAAVGAGACGAVA
jgi:hypothetical protein